MQEQLSRLYVGIDLHRRRSVIVRMGEDGKVLGTVRVDNDPVALALVNRRVPRTAGSLVPHIHVV